MGTEYLNSVFKNITDYLQIKHNHSTPYHPETIGGLERNHRNLNEFLRAYINNDLTDWDDWVPYYEFCYNTSPHIVHNYTPFELVFGKKACLPSDLRNNQIEPLYNLDDYSKEFRFRLKSAHSRAHDMLLREKEKRKIELDEKNKASYCDFRVGDLVSLKQVNQNKLKAIKDGPYKIICTNSSNAVIIHLETNKTKEVHKNMLTKY